MGNFEIYEIISLGNFSKTEKTDNYLILYIFFLLKLVILINIRLLKDKKT